MSSGTTSSSSSFSFWINIFQMVQKEYKSNRQCHVDWRIYEIPVQNLRFNNFDNESNLQIMTLLGQVHNLNKSELECCYT